MFSYASACMDQLFWNGGKTTEIIFMMTYDLGGPPRVFDRGSDALTCNRSSMGVDLQWESKFRSGMGLSTSSLMANGPDPNPRSVRQPRTLHQRTVFRH